VGLCCFQPKKTLRELISSIQLACIFPSFSESQLCFTTGQAQQPSQALLPAISGKKWPVNSAAFAGFTTCNLWKKWPVNSAVAFSGFTTCNLWKKMGSKYYSSLLKLYYLQSLERNGQ